MVQRARTGTPRNCGGQWDLTNRWMNKLVPQLNAKECGRGGGSGDAMRRNGNGNGGVGGGGSGGREVVGVGDGGG